MASTAQPRVFVTRCREAFPAEKMDILERKYQVSYWKEDSVIPKEDLISALHDKDALFCLLTDKIDSEVLAAARNMKVIATMSVGYDHLGTYCLSLLMSSTDPNTGRSGVSEAERHQSRLHPRGPHGRHSRADCGTSPGNIQEADGG